MDWSPLSRPTLRSLASRFVDDRPPNRCNIRLRAMDQRRGQCRISGPQLNATIIAQGKQSGFEKGQ